MIPAPTTAQLRASLRAAAQAESDAHHAEQLARWVR